MNLPTTIVLTMLCSLVFLQPRIVKGQIQAPSPTTELPQTAEEAYQTLVPESVQTARKDQEFAGQLLDLRRDIDNLKLSTPDKAIVEKLANEVAQIAQYNAALRQMIVSLQAQVKGIQTLLDTYGQGYQAANAAALTLQQQQQRSRTPAQQQSTDPLNP
jgi:hypothetical protein